MSWRNTFSAVAGVAVAACIGLAVYWPAVPKSFPGWLAFIFIGIPLCFFIEWAGEKVLSARFWERLSSVARVLIAIPVLLVLFVVVTGIVWFVRRLIRLP